MPFQKTGCTFLYALFAAAVFAGFTPGQDFAREASETTNNTRENRDRGKGQASQAEDAVITLSSLLDQCWDLKKLPYVEKGVSCKQFSSYDRTGWEANRDWGNFLRVSDEEGSVCAEMKGPGCVFRIWSANPSGTLFFYLDGEAEPALEADMKSLFESNPYPFLDPLTYRISGADAYIPIPYEESCKIVLRDNGPLYYHFGYKTYPDGTRIETYSPDRAEAARESVEKALVCLDNPGPGLVEQIYGEGLERVRIDARVEPDSSAELVSRSGSGWIALLVLKGSSFERHFLRKSLLKIYWDNEKTAAVSCPLGDFFGTSFGENRYRAVCMGVTEEGGYCLFPMPFEKGARIEIVNQGCLPVDLKGHLLLAPLPGDGQSCLRFHAGWRREEPCATFDYPILKAWGSGKFVGCALFIDNPDARWWGEGDEKIWVDGEDFPSTFGTGSEDYFGDAWGHRHHVKPYEGCTLIQDPRHSNKTCVYRFHITDSIPFSRSYKMTIENYAKDVDYTSVAWWYQARGGSDFFEDAPVSKRIPRKPCASGAVEIEDLVVSVEAEAGAVLEITDEGLPDELSGGKGLLLKGEGPFALTLPAEGDEGICRLFLGLASGLTCPELTVTAPDDVGIRASPVLPHEPGFLAENEAAMVELHEGGNSVYIHAAAREGETPRTVLDFLRIEPLRKRQDAIEAEDLAVVGAKGGAATKELLTLPWSGGTQVRFEADEGIATIEFELPVTIAGIYSITGFFTDTQGYGSFEVLLDGDRVADVDPSAIEGDGIAEFQTSPRFLAADMHELSFRTESAVGLDCFLLSWSLGEDNAFEGEKLKVLDHAFGEHLVQRLGKNRFSQGLHLWFRGEKRGAFVEVELPVREAGDYALKVFYCKSWDYGMIELFLDGTSLGEKFDGYCPNIVPSGPVEYGTISLEKGIHRLRFVLSGKNESSAGYFMGVDGLVLHRR